MRPAGTLFFLGFWMVYGNPTAADGMQHYEEPADYEMERTMDPDASVYDEFSPDEEEQLSELEREMMLQEEAEPGAGYPEDDSESEPELLLENEPGYFGEDYPGQDEEYMQLEEESGPADEIEPDDGDADFFEEESVESRMLQEEESGYLPEDEIPGQ
ncbi:MAG: hypothetical protein SCH71_14985 [Desulfobulbaceae bacterium]|nr:hypothetical protein [Desulfobulbaceae bacterium]